LANIKSSKKDIIRSRKRRARNRAWRSRCKSLVRSARTAIASGDSTVAVEIVRQASRQLDKAVTKGVIPKRQAARRKSRLARRLARVTDVATG
jgi:small subunit ribosomal protein S20